MTRPHSGGLVIAQQDGLTSARLSPKKGAVSIVVPVSPRYTLLGDRGRSHHPHDNRCSENQKAFSSCNFGNAHEFSRALQFGHVRALAPSRLTRARPLCAPFAGAFVPWSRAPRPSRACPLDAANRERSSQKIKPPK